MMIRTTLSKPVMCSDLSFLLRMFYELSKGRNSFLPLFLLSLFAIIELVEVVLMKCSRGNCVLVEKTILSLMAENIGAIYEK